MVITYRFPDGKNGDVNHAIARQTASPEQIGENLYQITLPAGKREIIECLCFPSRSILAHYDFTQIEDDPPAVFLLKYHRVFQIEHLMWQINYYNPKEYRNLRSVGDLVLRGILQERHNLVAKGRDELYEQLIADETTNARWISERKAYAIVREVYPDAAGAASGHLYSLRKHRDRVSGETAFGSGGLFRRPKGLEGQPPAG